MKSEISFTGGRYSGCRGVGDFVVCVTGGGC